MLFVNCYLISPTKGQETQKKKKILPEEAVALETYYNVYRNNHIEFRKFSNKQITQIYKLLLSKDNMSNMSNLLKLGKKP